MRCCPDMTWRLGDPYVGGSTGLVATELATQLAGLRPRSMVSLVFNTVCC